VYPNPASQFIVVYNYAAEKTRTATLYDLNGKAVRQTTLALAATRINIGTLASGLYILKVIDAKNATIRVEKIIVSH
jgi:hypothetical protein